MEEEKKDKKEENRFTKIENFSFKRIFKYSKYSILILVFFLFFIGIASLFFLSNEASKLAGGGINKEIVSYSKSSRFNLIEKLKYSISKIFEKNQSSKSEYSENNENEGENTFDADKKSSSLTAKGYGDKNSGGKYGSQLRTGYYNAGQRSLTEALKAELSSLESYLSGSQSQTSLSKFGSEGKGNIKINSSSARSSSNKPSGESGKSALELLKSTYKTSLFAARDASNDTARAWTNKTFDLAAVPDKNIEYDEKLRASLDRINPNAIPAFLKDPSLNSESMRSLKASDVPELSSDEEDKWKLEMNFDKLQKMMEEEDDNEKNNQSLNLNPLFNGLTKNDEEKEESEQEIDQKSYSVNPSKPDTATSPEGKVVESPSTPPDLKESISNVTTDEYGFIRVTQDDGSVQIFDPNTGKILGCEIPSEGMCVLPGNGGCPSDVYFT